MELWTFKRFQRPCLSIDAIENEKNSAVVSLQSGSQVYRFSFDDADAAAQVIDDLKSLSNPDAPLWTTLRDCPRDSAWYVLINFLDTHSLIRESHNEAANRLSEQEQRIRKCVENTKKAVLDGLSSERQAIVARHAEFLRKNLRCSDNHLYAFALENKDPFDPLIQPNFFLALLTVEFEYFRRLSPLTLMATDLLLELIAKKTEDEVKSVIGFSLTDTAGLYNEQDLESHLWLVGCSLVSSSSKDAMRFPTAPIPKLNLCSGLEFMRKTEILSRETLVDWGENPYVSAIDKLNGEYSPLVAGPFIEQYHVTRRFVEIIAPLLSMRLAAPLKSMMFRYFSEEYGHEALESTTCEALGVTEEVLNKILPLPLHFAFVDILTLFADYDPITSFAAVMAIEGIFGEPPKMSLRLVAAAKDNTAFREVAGNHDKLNESLNHNSISRNLFEQVKALSPDRQASTMRRILFLLELNHRAWADIAKFYGQQDRLLVQGAFGQRLDPQKGIVV